MADDDQAQAAVDERLIGYYERFLKSHPNWENEKGQATWMDFDDTVDDWLRLAPALHRALRRVEADRDRLAAENARLRAALKSDGLEMNAIPLPELADCLDRAQRLICVYTGPPCDCKYGMQNFGRPTETGNGCPELRMAARFIRRAACALADEPGGKEET